MRQATRQERSVFLAHLSERLWRGDALDRVSVLAQRVSVVHFVASSRSRKVLIRMRGLTSERRVL